MHEVSTEKVLDAFNAVIKLLDTPKPFPLSGSSFENVFTGWHPVFGLARHGRGLDDYKSGALGNIRGDVCQIPAFSEAQEVGVFELGFHKGSTLFTLYVYGGSEELRKAAISIIEPFETR